MKEGEGSALKPAARKAEIKAKGDYKGILGVCVSYLRRRTIYQKAPFS